MNSYPKDIKLTINEEKYWIGMGRQELSFHQVIGELIDNCISAPKKNEDGDSFPLKIEITIEKISEKIYVNILDNGTGITEKELIQHIFSPGGQGISQGSLNEHGFGLKNALCVLTQGNKLKWKILTRDDDALKMNKVYRVEGPFSSKMKLELSNENELNNSNIFDLKGTGTRIEIETSFDYFSTTYNRAKKFETLIIRFIEHIGVMYRFFLKNTSNKIIIRWKDTLDTSSIWNKHKVDPIEIYYDIDGSKEYKIELDGSEGKIDAKYRVGKLDSEKTQLGNKSLPYPLKIYYQGNQQTQGVDLIVRGRVVKSSLLKEIWKIDPHNSMNKFVGEIILNNSKFKTINNKLGLDPHNEYTVKLLDELSDNPKYKIEKVTQKSTEESIKKKFEINLKGMFTGATVQRERPIWSGSGVKVDVYLKESNNEITVYEFKTTTATPLDAYQLLMYWDGIVKDEQQSPKLGRLVASEISSSVKNIIEELNKRLDGNGKRYNIEAKTLAEMGLKDI